MARFVTYLWLEGQFSNYSVFSFLFQLIFHLFYFFLFCRLNLLNSSVYGDIAAILGCDPGRTFIDAWSLLVLRQFGESVFHSQFFKLHLFPTCVLKQTIDNFVEFKFWTMRKGRWFYEPIKVWLWIFIGCRCHCRALINPHLVRCNIKIRPHLWVMVHTTWIFEEIACTGSCVWTRSAV